MRSTITSTNKAASDSWREGHIAVDGGSMVTSSLVEVDSALPPGSVIASKAGLIES